MATKRKEAPQPYPVFESATEIEKLAGVYFKACKGKPLTEKDAETGKKVEVLDKNKQPVYLGQYPPTLSGLALALGFNGRLHMLGCKLADETQQTALLKAQSTVEKYVEECLHDKETMQGAKFILMNNFASWREKGKNDDEPLPNDGQAFEVKIKIVNE